MCHENRQFRMPEDMAGRSAKDHLSQPALGIGTLDEQIGVQVGGILEDRLTPPYGICHCVSPAPLQCRSVAGDWPTPRP
jgi:hypothetical protein